MEHDATSANNVPAHPPTTPVPIVRPPLRSTWPTVFGIIAMVFGVMGILNGLMALASPFLMDMVPNVGNIAALDVMKRWAPWTIASGVATAIVALVLMIGGLSTYRRRPAARRQVLTWAVLKVILGAASSVLAVLMQADQVQAQMNQMQTQQPGTMVPANFMMSIQQSALWLSLVFGIAWSWALPLFSLIWFNRRSVRADISSWASVPNR